MSNKKPVLATQLIHPVLIGWGEFHVENRLHAVE
jgi:hypothetical protein